MDGIIIVQDSLNRARYNEIVITNVNKVFYNIIKRLFDISVSLVGILMLIPITILVKIAYMLSGDFKKIIFIQKISLKNPLDSLSLFYLSYLLNFSFNAVLPLSSPCAAHLLYQL